MSEGKDLTGNTPEVEYDIYHQKIHEFVKANFPEGLNLNIEGKEGQSVGILDVTPLFDFDDSIVFESGEVEHPSKHMKVLWFLHGDISKASLASDAKFLINAASNIKKKYGNKYDGLPMISVITSYLDQSTIKEFIGLGLLKGSIQLPGEVMGLTVIDPSNMIIDDKYRTYKSQVLDVTTKFGNYKQKEKVEGGHPPIVLMQDIIDSNEYILGLTHEAMDFYGLDEITYVIEEEDDESDKGDNNGDKFEV